MTIKEFEIQYALGSLTSQEIWEFAANDNTSTKILAILAGHENEMIRWEVANNIRTL